MSKVESLQKSLDFLEEYSKSIYLGSESFKTSHIQLDIKTVLRFEEYQEALGGSSDFIMVTEGLFRTVRLNLEARMGRIGVLSRLILDESNERAILCMDREVFKGLLKSYRMILDTEFNLTRDNLKVLNVELKEADAIDASLDDGTES